MKDIKRALEATKTKVEQHDEKLKELQRREKRNENRLRFLELQTRVMRRP